jgi:hypothetical protein
MDAGLSSLFSVPKNVVCKTIISKYFLFYNYHVASSKISIKYASMPKMNIRLSH